ncbi:ABC transporter ATP-binding protein [Sporomusa acidovorans]|uniref:Nickel import system ATP-binding protein NikD n=1 Tax=Sporomusa acidovorans (strain ATCC 49682 / DSM 3132 / Mol) TaxID=1123286 RepID=A0ABZ3IY27_SPOA4|nr:ABC transporter ATP-binding protein [Sporomusa acidovorans]OZC17685.1 glutathione import ATP-binding protein GsiA [Sporomusa acidovorans DSM 3132]SDE12042.1 peptide/nickel transport system ATP-binding protein [Sporomusa acidovorans]
MAQTENILTIQNLYVSYGTTNILKDINLTVKAGQTLAVIGESGAGKSSLALAIAGLCAGGATGTVCFKNQNLLTASQEEMRCIRGNDISLVFQNTDNALHPLYTAVEQVTEAIMLHQAIDKSTAGQLALDTLAATGITGELAGLRPHELSGGQQQRVLIAMALVNNPELLLLDEPTAALDPLTKQEITVLLQQSAAGRACILITHDIATAAELADTVAVLYGGRIIELGPARTVLKDPRHPYTRGLLRAYPNMTTVKDLQGIPGSMQHDLPGCPFQPRCTQSLPDTCQASMPALTLTAGRNLACHRGGIVPVLQITNLTKAWDERLVVQNLTFTLYEGETLTIIGESGSGKTTLAKTIMGLTPLSSGEIRLNGNKITERKLDFYQQVQLVFQNPKEALSHRLTVCQLIKEPLDIQNIGTETDRVTTVQQLLTEVELPATDIFLHKYPHQLSGGEAQRVVIARALALNPKILIADEPTSALDASIQAKIIKLLLNLQENRGLAMLFITHDMALARKISDRLAVIQHGKIVEEGPAQLLTVNPSHPYTRKLLAAAARFP